MKPKTDEDLERMFAQAPNQVTLDRASIVEAAEAPPAMTPSQNDSLVRDSNSSAFILDDRLTADRDREIQ